MTRGGARAVLVVALAHAACGAPAGRADAVAPTIVAAPGVELTLRTGGPGAIVVDRRELRLAAGEQWIELDDLGVDVTHLSVRSLSHPGGLAVLEQLVDPGRRGAAWTPPAPGEPVAVRTGGGATVRGRLIAAGPDELVIETDAGVRRVRHDAIDGFLAPPGSGAGASSEPRVRLRVRASAAGTQLVELTYTLGGLGFAAEHRLTRVAAEATEAATPAAPAAAATPAPGDAASVDLRIETWIVVDNRAGRDFRAARVTLVEDPVPAPARRSFALAAPLTIAAGVELRVPLAPALTRRARRVLRFDGSGGLVAPQVQQLEPYFGTAPAPARVSEELRLEGVHLPAGRVRLHDVPAGAGAPAPVVDSTLAIAPDGDSATVPLGPGYGLSGQRRRVGLEWGQRKLVERFEISVRNDGDDAREVQVFELLYRTPSWRIVDESVAHTPAGARAVEFPFTVAPRAWGRVRYAVEYNW